MLRRFACLVLAAATVPAVLQERVDPAAFPRSGVPLAEGLSYADNLTLQAPHDFLRDFPARTAEGLVHAVIEIPAGCCEKWEVKSDGVLRWDMKDGKPRHVKYLGYPCNYGMVPRTCLGTELGGDGFHLVELRLDLLFLLIEALQVFVELCRILATQQDVLPFLDLDLEGDLGAARVVDGGKDQRIVGDRFVQCVVELARLSEGKGADRDQGGEGDGNEDEQSLLDLEIHGYSSNGVRQAPRGGQWTFYRRTIARRGMPCTSGDTPFRRRLAN